MKRIVSLVPSWTETLIEAGANVVGRTRFCIHPVDRVISIPAIGGTKSFDVEKLRSLAPDLIVMDREENTLEMFELAREVAPVHVSHVENVSQMPNELRALADAVASRAADDDRIPSVSDADADSGSDPDFDTGCVSSLRKYAQRFEIVLAKSLAPISGDSFPGVIKVLKGEIRPESKFIYLIWKDPWMSINHGTFIASMLDQIGIGADRLVSGQEGALSGAAELLDDSRQRDTAKTKYPKLVEVPQHVTVLLSSEPYPFARKPVDLTNANIALVDGESFSWFGLRALRFLESAKR